MRAATTLRLLLLLPTLLAAACDGTSSPAEPDAEDGVPAAGPLEDLAYWADGYLLALDPTSTSYTVGPYHSYNRTGGTVTITRPAGTTGRYVATFKGLSALLGSRSTVHATAHGDLTPGAVTSYCKPVGAYLASDKVEVRCFKPGTGTPVNSQFTLLVIRDGANLAFAYAHQAIATNYAPAAQGSWNPAGTTKVIRNGLGNYLVTFNGFGALPLGVGGHVQVNAVSTTKAHCEVGAWGGSPNMAVRVHCFTPAGAPADAKFTVLFLQPSDRLAYALADQLTLTNYSPNRLYSANPGGGTVSISHYSVGEYSITWRDAGVRILDPKNVQVTGYGSAGAQCKVAGFESEIARVRCFNATGAPVNSYFTVLLGS